MRPLRLLLSLATSLIALTFLLYIAFGSQSQQTELRTPTSSTKKNKLNALFSFTSPASLFPPSAIISLTDDNSTFFLARPAAFGPLLPSKGLSGPLWIGSGFGEDSMSTGELGCSDVPGWNNGDNPAGAASAVIGGEGMLDSKVRKTYTRSGSRSKTENGGVAESLNMVGENDGTDDHLHHAISPTGLPRPKGKVPQHADIESIQESAEITGKVVLLKRGGCGFLEKVKWAQNRGGMAVIVGDDVRGGALIRMYAHGDTSNITIPSLFTSHTTAHLLSSLLPSEGVAQNLPPEIAAKLELIKAGKAGKGSKNKTKTEKNQYSERRASFTRSAAIVKKTDGSGGTSWLRSLLYTLGMVRSKRTLSEEVTRSSSSLDLEDSHRGQKPMNTKTASQSTSTALPAIDDFVIGEHDWRDPAVMPKSTTTESPNKGTELPSTIKDINEPKEHHKGWLSSWFGGSDDAPLAEFETVQGSNMPPSSSASSNQHSKEDDKEPDEEPDEPDTHEGLWVTLTPTNMSSSPFFDTLLVLVVSPLVTLTVVYALLLLRSRIRRRRWRAPKSVVERLPVRTYHTISDSSTTPTATPVTSSPTTPLLQHTHSRPSSSHSRPRSRNTIEVPATSSSFQQSGRTPEEEKREAGLAEWRRRYGGRQKECVVCLEEYVDGVSRVMSLPCGHEFHADCM
jgi:hypothetical protein